MVQTLEHDSLSAQSGTAPDFRVYTASLEPENATSSVVRMVGSSTEKDVQKNRMARTAIDDMCSPDLVGMTIFLNHSYNLPHDVYGRLIAAPRQVWSNGFIDVHLTVDTDTDNPPARQTLEQIRRGNKHGCSIGCMVEEWDFAGESDDPYGDVIVIKRVRPVEWSVVGIPANRRSWVENAIRGVFTRSLGEGNTDEAYRLAPTMKGLYSRSYEKLTLSLGEGSAEYRRFAAVQPRPTPEHRVFWEPLKKSFVLTDSYGQQLNVSQEQIAKVLEVGAITAAFASDAPPPSWMTAMGDTLAQGLTLAADDSAKSAQQARSSKYGIGIKEGGSVTKPGKWSSVPDSEWGDPVNYRYPMPDKAHADNAASRWGDASNRSQYNSHEQSIIGGRIKRRQASFGESSDSKEKSVKPELVEAQVAVQQDGSHEPVLGHHSHPHSDMHEGLHDHHHTHNGDNTHQHTHDVHLAVDQPISTVPTQSHPTQAPPNNEGGSAPTSGGTGSQPFGELEVVPGSSNRPGPSGGSRDVSHDHPSMQTPIGGTLSGKPSGVGDGDNDTDDQADATTPQGIPAPNVMRTVQGDERATLLSSYNSLGRILGFSPVDHNGQTLGAPLTRTDGTAIQGAIEKLLKLSPTVSSVIDNLFLALACTPDVILTGRALSTENLGHAKRAHDALYAMTDGAVCGASSVAPSPDPTASDGPVQGGSGISPIDAANTARTTRTVTRNIPITATSTMGAQPDVTSRLEQRIDQLSTYIEEITGKGLGRPTGFSRSVPQGIMTEKRFDPFSQYDPNAAGEVPTDVSELRKQTLIVLRADGIKCRKWPAGVGKNQRPELSGRQLSLMRNADEMAYYTGAEALVPIVHAED